MILETLDPKGFEKIIDALSDGATKDDISIVNQVMNHLLEVQFLLWEKYGIEVTINHVNCDEHIKTEIIYHRSYDSVDISSNEEKSESSVQKDVSNNKYDELKEFVEAWDTIVKIAKNIKKITKKNNS